MKIGDKVKMSSRNENHLGNDTCAYAGMEGVVDKVYEDGAFTLNCGTAWLIVPMNDAWKNPLRGVWIYLNGRHIFHERINTTPKKPSLFRRILNFLK